MQIILSTMWRKNNEAVNFTVNFWYYVGTIIFVNGILHCY